ncbi:MAG: hypothetical protein Q8P76_02295 [bacterium]|nr:hypothetical protein [bacterium]
MLRYLNKKKVSQKVAWVMVGVMGAMILLLIALPFVLTMTGPRSCG